MIRYLLTKEIPNDDAYMRTRVLRVEDAFAVNESGILCRLWYRDPRSHNIVEPVYQVYVPEELRGAVIETYHGGNRSGHFSPIKTWQKVRDMFW